MPSASSKQAALTTTSESSEAMRQALAVVEKKARNLEKRKGKLDVYKVMSESGKELNKDQLDAIAKYDEVASNLEFAKDLVKQFQSIVQDDIKQQKKLVRREQLQRQEYGQQRIRSVLELQDLLEQLGDEKVRKDFTEGTRGAVAVPEEQLKHIDMFYKLVSPTREPSEGSEKQSFSEKLASASEHLMNLLEARPKEVCETTYKELKQTIDQILESGYLDNMPSNDSENGETEAEPEEAVEESKEGEDYVVVDPEEVPPADAPEVESSLPPELPPQVTAEEPSLPPSTNGPLLAESILPPHKPQRDVNEVLAAVQGDFNFMQESMIDFQSPHMDPAVVAVATSQPFKPPQVTQSAIPQPSQQDPSTHSALEQLSQPSPLDQLTQQASALESVMRSASLSTPQSINTQEQYSSTDNTSTQQQQQQHSNLATQSSLSTAAMLGQRTLVSSPSLTDSQTNPVSHMSQTLPSQSMTGGSQLSESSQLPDTLSAQLSSVQTNTSLSSTVPEPSQSLTLQHEQSQQQQTTQEQTQPAPVKSSSSQINVNAPPFQSTIYQMRQPPSYMQPASQTQVVTTQPQGMDYSEQGMQQTEAQYFTPQQTLQDTQTVHDQQMTVQTSDTHAPGSYPHQQHPGSSMTQPGGYPRSTSVGRGNGRGGRGSRGAGGSGYRGSNRPTFPRGNGRFQSSYRGGYSTYASPRDFQSSYSPQDRNQYGGFSQGGYKRGGGGGVPPRSAPRGK
ncbi:uncharacterized protein LOC144448524 isoform X2 [Glandiceps talaboti]